MKRKAISILAPALMLTLAACATPFKADVSRFQQMPAPQGQTFIVKAADPANEGGIEFGQYAAMVRRIQADVYPRMIDPTAP